MPVDESTAAFEALYRRELKPLTMVAAALTGSPEVAAELANEALVRAWASWSSVGTLERPGAWLRRVVINLAIDSTRRSRREQRAVGRLAVPVQAPPDEPPDARFWSAVRDLPERQRLTVVLRYVSDLSVHEIADVMGVADGTVKTALHMARHTLATVLGTQEVVA